MVNSPVNNPPEIKVAVKQITRAGNAASGDVSTTGLGFKPSALIAFGVNDTTAHVLSQGIGNSTIQANQFYSGDSILTQDTNVFLRLEVAYNATGQKAIIKSFDADGFTLTWTKVGAPGASSNTITVLAFR